MRYSTLTPRKFQMGGLSFIRTAATTFEGDFGNEDERERGPPALIWEEAAAAPVARLDGAAVQIAHVLYVFAGYATIDEVHAHVDVYNMSSNVWESKIPMPAAMAYSHLGMATNGRFIYILSGQFGSRCRRPTARNFVLDTLTKTWSLLLPLPYPRYAPATQLWRGRLHVMEEVESVGVALQRDCQITCQVYPLTVKPLTEYSAPYHPADEMVPNIPHHSVRGKAARAYLVVDDDLYVIGGEKGDFKAKPGSLDFKCSRQMEYMVMGYMLKKEARRWRELPSLPKPISYIQFAWVAFNRSIVIVGGSTKNHLVTKKMVLLGNVFHFNTEIKVWRKLGQMLYRGRTILAVYWNGWLHFMAGQRDKGPSTIRNLSFL